METNKQSYKESSKKGFKDSNKKGYKQTGLNLNRKLISKVISKGVRNVIGKPIIM